MQCRYGGDIVYRHSSLAQCASWHSLTFYAFVQCPFCPCQCCSIDDQDNYKPVNQQLAHETQSEKLLRSISWILYVHCCHHVKAPLHKYYHGWILLTPACHFSDCYFFFLLLSFWHLFHSGIRPRARELVGRRTSEWETRREGRWTLLFNPPEGKGGERLTAI